MKTRNDRIKEDAQKLHTDLDNRVEVLTFLQAGLETLHGVQMVVSSLDKDCIPENGEHASTDQVRTYMLALIVELTELVQELNWKPWKNHKHINQARVADEFADVLAFLGILIIYLDSLGIPPSRLAEAYVSKTKVNIERMLGMVAGYEDPQNK